MHSDIKLLMDREQELANSGWNMTPGELAAHANVLKAAACWFAFAHLHPREAQEFLIAEDVSVELLRSNSSRT